MVKLRDFLLFAAQIRAARGLLGWSQAALAKRSGINRTTLIDMESGKREPLDATQAALLSELDKAGIAFRDKGVEFKKWPPKKK